MLVEEQHSQLKYDLESVQSELDYLRKENQVLRVDAEKTKQMQSAVQSNNALVAERIAETNQ